jgi:fucose permease
VTESGELGFSRQDILVITACAISMLIVQMDWFALNLAIPAIAKHFNVASTDLQWVVSGYMLSIGALMVTAGRLADIFGRRLGLAWALTQVATQAVVPAEYAGAASGDFVRVACRGRRRDRCGCVRARRGLSRSCAERCTRA